MGGTYRLAIVTTHPIQYYSEWYRALAAHPELDVHVYYCHEATAQEQASAGFGIEFEWDVPLLTGYTYTFLKNVAEPPGQARFAGFDTPEIKDIIRSRKHDAVMVLGWNYKSAWQAIWTCWKCNIKVMTRGDSHLHTPRTLPTRMAKYLLYRRFVPRFDACLAVGKWSREYFLHYGAKPENLFFVPHAVNNEFFRSESKRLKPLRSQLRMNWGLDEHAIVFAFAGKFIEKKRPMDFLQAVHQAATRNSKIQGLMIGDGPLRPVCEEFGRSRSNPVRYTGFLNQSKIAEAYVACDALVLPSDGGETWGLVVNEAMACGRPCLVSDRVGCGPDLISSGQTGTIFPLGDVNAITAAMLEMASDPVRMAAMSAEANWRIQDYSVSVAVDGVVQCLTTMLDPHVLYAAAR